MKNGFFLLLFWAVGLSVWAQSRPKKKGAAQPFVPSARAVLAWGPKGTVFVLDPAQARLVWISETGKVQKQIPTTACKLSFSQGRIWLADSTRTLYSSKNLQRWDTLSVPMAGSAAISQVQALGPDRLLVALAGNPAQGLNLRLESKTLILERSFQIPAHTASEAYFSPDGRYLGFATQGLFEWPSDSLPEGRSLSSTAVPLLSLWARPAGGVQYLVQEPGTELPLRMYWQKSAGTAPELLWRDKALPSARWLFTPTRAWGLSTQKVQVLRVDFPR